MNEFQKGMFDKIQKKANIDPNEVFQVANSVKNADFSDEATVRNLVRRLATLANKPLSKEKEDQLVRTIITNKMPADFNSLFKK
ncbi:stage VI sporulation protein F [Aciduricibacillus chroicocephali]|uniref:Stage VI sporulation protein F n=1 Tax=Aciduricibacillus chroicocephali TaxID=3054939 RepID=A0ABY9KRK8_9BACI|nr:stage VI sporulation protein F [Bacillaceae bacterium 44XB]